MNKTSLLLAEKKYLEETLAELPNSAEITKMSTRSRIANIDEKLVELRFLLAEKNQIEDLIAHLSPTELLDRASLERRLSKVNERLDELEQE
jgi:ABC-type phosphate transport system auxiliary subunit